MNNLAIIPARGGSKRIPRKNIKFFLGIPIIAYSIKAALESKLFKEVIVSTDDDEIKEKAISYGASVPFMRTRKNSNDHATTFSVIEEVILKLKNKKKHFDNVCCIYPCSPLIEVKNILDAYNILINQNKTTVFPIVKYSTPIQRALTMEKNKIEFLFSENQLKRSQDFDETFYDAGQFYWLNVKNFLLEKKLISNNSSSIILNEFETQDIDNINDFKLAEIKYKLKKGFEI
jgi:pseudaminic acid cytidylyltransferase